MPRDRDVGAFDERAPDYETGRHGRLHREIADRTVQVALGCGHGGPVGGARVLAS